MSRLQQSEDRKGIMAAVIAAIAAYIEEEEAVTPVAVQRSQVPVLSLWHASGREEIMRMRTLWQRRIVSK